MVGDERLVVDAIGNKHSSGMGFPINSGPAAKFREQRTAIG